MPGSADSTSAESDLKEYYADGAVKDIAYEVAGSFYAEVTKKEDFAGKYFVQPVQIGRAQGRSHDSTTALANKSPNNYKDFNVTMAEDFGTTSVTRKLKKQTRNNRGGFFDAMTREFDGIIKTLSRNASIECMSNGGGARGQLSATTAINTATLTLMSAEMAANFDLGMKVQFDTTDGTSGTVEAGTNTIIGIDEDAGTITGSSVWNVAIPTIATSGYLFQEGDFGAAIKGLLAWLPPTAPTAGDSFFGVDRSAHVTKLAGHRHSATTIPIVQGVRTLSSKIGRRGGSPDRFYSSHDKYNTGVLELGSKQEFMTQGKAFDAEVYFEGVKVHGYKNTIKWFPDHTCPTKYGFLVTLGSIKLASMGPVPDIFDDDGQTLLRESTGWGSEMRADVFANLVFDEVADHGVLTLE